MDKDVVDQNQKQIELSQRQTEIQQQNLNLQRDFTLSSRGISEQQLKEEEATRQELKLQKQVLQQMFCKRYNDSRADKEYCWYQERQRTIERTEKRLEQRANRQVAMQNLKQTLSLQGISKGLQGLTESIKGIGSSAFGVVKDSASKLGTGLIGLLKAGGLVTAFFGFKAFLDSKLFQDLTNFMKSLAPQFEQIAQGFKDIFDGQILKGLGNILLGLAGIVGKILDSFATGLYNIFARAFGLEETDSVFGSIKNAIMTVVNKITGFFGTVKDVMIDFAMNLVYHLI